MMTVSVMVLLLILLFLFALYLILIQAGARDCFFLSEQESEFDNWSFVSRSFSLYGDNAHQTVCSRMHICDPSHGPVLRECVILFEKNNIADLEVG